MIHNISPATKQLLLLGKREVMEAPLTSSIRAGRSQLDSRKDLKNPNLHLKTSSSPIMELYRLNDAAELSSYGLHALPLSVPLQAWLGTGT